MWVGNILTSNRIHMKNLSCDELGFAVRSLPFEHKTKVPNTVIVHPKQPYLGCQYLLFIKTYCQQTGATQCFCLCCRFVFLPWTKPDNIANHPHLTFNGFHPFLNKTWTRNSLIQSNFEQRLKNSWFPNNKPWLGICPTETIPYKSCTCLCRETINTY